MSNLFAKYHTDISLTGEIKPYESDFKTQGLNDFTLQLPDSGIFLDSALNPYYTKFMSVIRMPAPNFSCLKYLIITWR